MQNLSFLQTVEGLLIALSEVQCFRPIERHDKKIWYRIDLKRPVFALRSANKIYSLHATEEALKKAGVLHEC